MIDIGALQAYIDNAPDDVQAAYYNLADEARDVIDERDELQRRIDAYEGRLEEWEEIDRLIAASSLGGEEAQRVRDTVPPQVGKAIVRAVQEAERADRAEAERDRLRAVVDAVLVWQRQMADLACAVDVLHVADLYRIVTAAEISGETDG